MVLQWAYNLVREATLAHIRHWKIKADGNFTAVLKETYIQEIVSWKYW